MGRCGAAQRLLPLENAVFANTIPMLRIVGDSSSLCSAQNDKTHKHRPEAFCIRAVL
jgi:hypothetical protein